MKFCKKCLENKEEFDFYKNHDECKTCWKAYCKARNQRPDVKEKVKEFQKSWRDRNKEKVKEYNKYQREKNKEKYNLARKTPEKREENRLRKLKWRSENREKHIASEKEYKAKNREKINARFKVTNAIRRGKMTRGIECEICRTKEGKMDAHHNDYSKPLEVKWLCKICHKQQHNALMDLIK